MSWIENFSINLLEFLIYISITGAVIYFVSYLRQKGTHLATKEDIESITKITEPIKTDFSKEIESLKSEYSVISRAYGYFVENIIDYYSLVFQHYIRCQRVSEYEWHYPLNGPPENTTEMFIKQLDEFSEEWNSKLGKTKLLLPDELLVLHESIQNEFNKFRDIVMNSPKNLTPVNQDDIRELESYKSRIKKSFKEIHNIKEKMEPQIRSVLRVNKLKMDK